MRPGSGSRGTRAWRSSSPPGGSTARSSRRLTRLHRSCVAALLEAGIPVLCEKPCGLTAAETRELAERAGRAGVVLRVGYWRRFVPELARLRRRIAAGELGAVSFLYCFQWDERPPSAAFRDPRSSGGIVVDMAVHELDLLRWLTGQEIGGIAGFASSVCFDPPIAGDPESASLAVWLSGGATALVTVGRRHAPGEVVRVEVIGTEGAEELRVVAPPDGEAVVLAALRAQAEAFAAAARGGATPAATGEDAALVLEAAERATRVLMA